MKPSSRLRVPNIRALPSVRGHRKEQDSIINHRFGIHSKGGGKCQGSGNQLHVAANVSLDPCCTRGAVAGRAAGLYTYLIIHLINYLSYRPCGLELLLFITQENNSKTKKTTLQIYNIFLQILIKIKNDIPFKLSNSLSE